MKTKLHLANIVILLALVFVPSIGLAWLGSVLQWDVTWLIPIVAIVVALFGFEIISIRLSQRGPWAQLSTWRDKIIFAIGLAAMLIVAIWPIQQKIESAVVKFAFLVIGYSVMLVFVRAFASRSKSRSPDRTKASEDRS